MPLDLAEPAPNDAYRRVAFPVERRLVIDTLRAGRRWPMMHGLAEVDVTRARRLMQAHRERTGEAPSFTAFVLACVGRAVAAHPEVHALRDWLGRLVMFEDVDVTTIVEAAAIVDLLAPLDQHVEVRERIDRAASGRRGP